MVGLAELVGESLARHGVETRLDPRRLRWSKWFRCESAFSFLVVPDAAGIFALAEEIIAPSQVAAAGEKRFLAIYRIAKSDDLGLTMGRLFLPGGQEYERLPGGRCFARYAVVEDAAQRNAACSALQEWMASVADAAIGSAKLFALEASAASSNKQAQIETPAPLPCDF